MKSECLHPICHAYLKSFLDFRAHLMTCIILRNHVQTVSRKRKSEDDEEKMQDTKGEALNYVSKKVKIKEENNMS